MLKFKIGCEIQRRYILVGMLTIGAMLLFAIRNCFTLTMYELETKTVDRQHRFDEDDACPAVKNLKSKNKSTTVFYSFTERSLISSSFYVGYILTHIPSGAASDIYGGKHFFGLGVLMSACTIALFPLIMMYFPWWTMAIATMSIGAFQGMSVPAAVSLLAHWMPSYQRTLLATTFFAGQALGIITVTYTANYFIATFDNWRILFYFWAVSGILYYILYLFTVYSSVDSHPHPVANEKVLLREGASFPKVIPWRRIIKDEATWSLLAGEMGHNWVLLLTTANMPVYLKHMVGLDIHENVVYTTAPYWCLITFAVLGAHFADRMVKKGFIPVGYLRSLYTAGGSILPSIFVLLGSYLGGCNDVVVMIFFSLCLLSMGAFYAGLKISVFDLTRHYAGTFCGIENGLGGSIGIMTPLVISYVGAVSAQAAWRQLFWLTLSVCIFSSTLYFIWIRAERASWDHLEAQVESLVSITMV